MPSDGIIDGAADTATAGKATGGNPLEAFERARATIARAREQLSGLVFGQDAVIDQCLMVLLAGGHGLLVGVPGLAKTRLVTGLGRVFGLDEARVQCTPDLMPSDILGTEILEDGTDGRRHFRFIEGPVFTNLLMVDEINRASPRTQSALLQAMEEGQASIAGEHRPLPKPFHVLATQNPIEQEGTFPLPEAQLDRFLMQIDVPYPDAESERRIVVETTGAAEGGLAAVTDRAGLEDMQAVIREMPLSDRFVSATVALVRAARPETASADEVRDYVAHGPGPRASQALARTARAHALLGGRGSPDIADLKAVAPAVLRHRLLLQYAAHADGVGADGIIDRLLAALAADDS